MEKGNIGIEATGEPSFMYLYTINILAVEFPGAVDDLMLPIMARARQYQPDLLLNPDNNRKVEFDADIISDDRRSSVQGAGLGARHGGNR